MKKAALIFTARCCMTGLCAASLPCAAQEAPSNTASDMAANTSQNISPWDVTSVMLSAGPILTHHFQSGKDTFVDHHNIGILQFDTADRGNWALYYLGPNSVGRQTLGAGYVTDPYIVPLGPLSLELSAAFGLVSGYQNYPVPLIGAQMRLDLYQSGPWNAGIEVAALPYIARDKATGKNKIGVVGTTPFLSVRYSF